MIKTLITEFPLSEVLVERTVTEEKIRKYAYSKEEVDALITDASLYRNIGNRKLCD